MEATLGKMATTIVLGLWFIGWALVLDRIDIREHRLSNRMVAVCFAGCVIATLVHAIVVAEFAALVTPAIASLAAATCFVIGHVTGGIEKGDVKFALVTGWTLGTIGWSAVWWGHVVAFVIAGVAAAGGWLLRGWRRDRPVAFGPFMGLGVIVAGAATLGSVG